MTFSSCLSSIWSMVNYVTTATLGKWLVGVVVVVVVVKIINRMCRR